MDRQPSTRARARDQDADTELPEAEKTAMNQAKDDDSFVKAKMKGEKIIAEGKVWQKVKGSKPWRPTYEGDSFTGIFLAKSTRPGDNGSGYGVSTFRTSEGDVVTVAGAVITNLVEAAALEHGASVRVVYTGEETSRSSGRTFRKF